MSSGLGASRPSPYVASAPERVACSSVGEAKTDAMCLQAAWMCVISTTKSTSTFEPSVPRNAVMVTVSSATTACVGAARRTNGGRNGDSMTTLLLRLGGVIQLNAGFAFGVIQLKAEDTVAFGATQLRTGFAFTGEGAASDGDGGFRNPNIRATMLADVGLVPMLLLLLLRAGGGGVYNSAGLFSTTRDHRKESRGRKHTRKSNR